MAIIYCPVCGKNIKYSPTCPRCGYEGKKDYEVYPTISLVEGNIESVETRRTKHRKEIFQVYFNECMNSVISNYSEGIEKYLFKKTGMPIGETILFGAYKQDEKSNEKKAIKWIVLDRKEDKLLLISKYALDCKPYHIRKESTTWEKCSLRAWLNSNFISDAFDAKELNRIVETKVTADMNPQYYTDAGNDTKDKVFLLSINEAQMYFKSNESRLCKATGYAVYKNARVNGDGNCWWWLRSPGYNGNIASVVLDDGFINDSGYYAVSDNYAIRPALWITLKS